MSITKELESLKGLVMDRKSIDLTDRIYIRGLINEVIKEAELDEKGPIDVPECVDYSKIKTTWTIDPKNIGADR